MDWAYGVSLNIIKDCPMSTVKPNLNNKID